MHTVTRATYLLLQHEEWGWRLSLAMAGVPAIVFMVGSFLLPDTPNSLIERGKLEQGERVLRKIRGTDGK